MVGNFEKLNFGLKGRGTSPLGEGVDEFCMRKEGMDRARVFSC